MRKLAAIAVSCAWALLAPGLALAAPAAGTVIGNQASATYSDAGGTSRSATSNLVQTTVVQVNAFTLTANGARTAAPGQTVYYPHTLTNTGNGTDTYALNAPVSSSFGVGPHASLAYYIDANGDGVPDNATPINTSGPLAAGAVFRFVVAGTVPGTAANGSSATITVSATDSTPTTATNTDTTTVAASVIGVTKAFSSPSGPSPSGPITITLSYVNTGTAAATGVQITDVLPATLTYVAGSGRASLTGGTALTDANDGVEQAGTFPPGVDFRSTLGAGATVTAIIPSVAAGASGNVTFQVNVNANLAPQSIANTAQYQTSSQPSTSTNTATFQVLQGAGVVANGSATVSANGTAEPVVIATAAAGTTIAFNNYVWNRGNGSDTFDMTITSNGFPPGTTVTLLQQDGATPLLNSGGSAAPDTGPIPGAGQPCAAPFVSDTTVSPSICGYRVVTRVTLPTNAPNAAYTLVKRATSVFNNAVFDEVSDTLGAVAANTVDVTNDRAAPPAGTAVVADGLGPTTTAVIRTNVVTPGGAAIVTRFRVWVTNSGAVADDFNLAALFAASTAAGATPPTLPAGWSVVFRADASGAAADCTTVGAPLVTTGAIAAGAARLVCAEVTVPPLASGTAVAGNYDFDFSATSAANASVSDVIRDRVTLAAARNMTLTPDNTSQTFANGTIVYVHTLANLGGAADTATFPAGCLTDTRAGWTSTAYVDANANGTLEIGIDTPITCGVSSVTLNPGQTRAIFVRVTAPAGALASDPANVTTIRATYASAIQATDTTSIAAGLTIVKEQQGVGVAGCTDNFPLAANYSQAAIAASPATIPGACIAYRVTATNNSAASVSLVMNDAVPANTRVNYACSGNGVSSPSATGGAVAVTMPADGTSGNLNVVMATLPPGLSAVLYFCVRIDPAAPGTSIVNVASGTGTQGGNSTSATSNTVTAAVGTPAGAVFAAVLAQNNRLFALPGATLYQAHTLTNTGTLTDTYTLTVTDPGGGWNLNAVLFLDANGDGQPDSAVPLTGPVTLAPGQVLRFVARLNVPASGFSGNDARALIAATSVGGAVVAPVTDTVTLIDNTPRDCAVAGKSLSRINGPSPLPSVTVTIAYSPCDKARSKLFIADKLPAGMRYIPGSGRWSGTGAAALSDAVVGTDREGAGASQIAYDWNVTVPGTVTAWIYNIPANSQGSISFNVAIEPGIAIGTEVVNTAEYNFYSATGAYELRQFTSATYTVDGAIDLRLTGMHVPTANPGSTVTFTNVLTNLGTRTDTFDITLSGSTFPAGAVITLFKADGTTLLADTDGNGTPDSGPLAPGASYNIVVKVALPESTPPGPYKVMKTARSAASPSRFVTVDDSVDAVAQACRVTLEPDNQATIGRGQHVTYTHYLTNHGNCQETVRAMADYLADSKPGWTSAVYVDNKVAGRGSLPGVVDATDTRIQQAWSQVLAPGESVRILVDVQSPDAQAAKALAAKQGAASAKQVVDSNVTTLVLTSASSGALTVHDTTLIDAQDGAGQPENVIRNFTDASYASPTFWAVVGRNLFIRADAASCNADPAVAESRTVIITGANGEREQATAVETGPNTGVFVLPALAVRAPPVIAADGIVEGSANDVFDFEILGCGRRIANVVTIMEAASVVFDSRTNEPVAGASVTLVAASGGQCTSAAAPVLDGGANPVVTGADGVFRLRAAAGNYCLVVKPPNGYRFASQVPYTRLPPGHNLNVSGLLQGGSYGNAFSVGADGFVIADVPVDAAAQDGLFVQKAASRPTAEIGEFVDYTVRVRNGTGRALDRAEVTLTDTLPQGFAYVAGTARRDGRRIDDPSIASSGLTLRLGHLAAGDEALITYRVRIGPGAMQGDGVNRVQASYVVGAIATLSNIAAAQVKVTGGVFTDKGFILGKVFMDCNANGVQDRGEEGVPGVRMFLEDGTSSTTDGLGKFSFYGVSNRTHVVKADRSTLPRGATLAAISSRHLGDGGSRIVDLKAGEMHRADFAVAGCDQPVVEEARKRAAALDRRADETALAATQLATETRIIPDLKTLPASGEVSAAAPAGAPSSALPGSNPASHAPPASAELPRRAAPAPVAVPAAEPEVSLEAAMADVDNTLAFLGPVDGATLRNAQSAVRVKGTLGSTFELTVNGRDIPAKQVAKRSVLESRALQAWEYLGVDFNAGDNDLAVVQRDSFGNERGRASIKILAPGRVARIAIEIPKGAAIADGRTQLPVTVSLFDARGLPVTARTPVTLDTSLGTWDVPGTDPRESGIDIVIEGGTGTFAVMAPIQPGEARIIATSGKLREEVRVHFMPELRSLIAAGVVEGIVNIRRLDARSLVAARRQDGFERELLHLSRTSGDGRIEAGARAAFFLKGKIRGEYLLTAAYDSDKDTRERLFRDIQPDEFYPVYGDSATRGYDAQSTARLYVRIDHKKSYLLYGDFNTQVETSVRRLSGYSRSLTGVREHYDNGRIQANVFASRDSTRQKIDEFRANGTSGPYTLSSAAGLTNSEKVEILTRDRNRPALVLATSPQARFFDYEIEPLTGRLLFKAPVPSVDQELNPISIRVTYEIDQGGPEFWVYGGDAQVKLGERVEVGASFAEDKNPADPFRLRGGYGMVRLGEHTTAVAEVARTEHEMTVGQGDAARIHIRHDGERLKAEAFVARTDPTFDNPGAYLAQGRGESGARLSLKIDERTSLKAEALRTEDRTTHNVRDGYLVALERSFANEMKVELGLRHAREEAPALPTTPLAPGSTGTTPNEVTSVRARVTGPVPGVAGATVYGEVEVDTQDAGRKIVALGGDYPLANKGKLYFRHEFISSLTGPYGLNEQQRQNTTVLGLDTEYMKDARLFSEYRIHDAISGGDAEAAIGLRNLWSIAPGWRLGTTLERVQAFSGNGQNDNTAVALGLEYVGSPTWKGSTRIELRDASAQQSLLHTLGFASRISREWTFLARNAISIQRNKGGDLAGAQHLLERMQAGVAFRDADTDRVNALARVEHREERDDTQVGVNLRRSTDILSVHGDYKLSRPFMLSGHYAAKWTDETSNGIATRYRAQLAAGRATWEFAPKWDAGLAVSGLFGGASRSRQYAVGIEVGYLLATNLWLSAGYNVFGYHDDDLAAGDYTNKGAYLRLRYKFDEALLGTMGEGNR